VIDWISFACGVSAGAWTVTLCLAVLCWRVAKRSGGVRGENPPIGRIIPPQGGTGLRKLPKGGSGTALPRYEWRNEDEWPRKLW
jgi:hypothetical protein